MHNKTKTSTEPPQISPIQYMYVSFKWCHTLPDRAIGSIADSKILCPFVSVSMHFFVRSSCGECIPCQVISVLSGPIRWQVLDMF